MPLTKRLNQSIKTQLSVKPARYPANRQSKPWPAGRPGAAWAGLVLGTPGSVLSAPVNSVYCAPMRLVPSIVPDSRSLVYCGALRFAV